MTEGEEGEASSNPKERRRHPHKKDKAKGDRDDGDQGVKAGVVGDERKVTHDDTCLNCNGLDH